MIVQRSQGRAKSHIAKDLGITHNTVNRILEESDVERLCTAGQQLSAGLIPQAIRVAEHRLSQNSENMAIKVLENTIWPLNGKNRSAGMRGDLMVNIQNLIQSTTPAKPLESAIECVQTTAQVDPARK